MVRALLLGLAGLLTAVPIGAQTDPSMTAREATRMLEDAASALREADGARDRVEALTETVRAYEHGLDALRAGIREAALREQTIVLVFEAERERLAQLLGVLQRIEEAPAPATLLHPEGPLGTARLGMIVADVTPAVAREAVALREQLEELAVLRALQDGAIAELERAVQGVQEARTELSQAIADRVDLPERFDLDGAAMAQLAGSIDSLSSFASLLGESTAETTADLPDFESARGDLALPVLGALLRRFDEADAAGIARPGVLYAVEPRALLTAPWPASIRYAGPLLDYGNVIILEPDADYLLILAGAGDLFVSAGELVPGGAPLGLMPGQTGEDETDLIVSEAQGGGAGLTETLYMELRQGGSPVNPLDWFTAN
ncbi:murein hydrolase activator EnvC [Gymnodinialimonas hymeniacidonis]|uniref:murein hydrolase activator EnvC family protein n=1 Tax=Gymnodinialimonas hymeniacidonis TaxID=3126508 RepID=UPI0034C6C72F